jgi:hypothetical protein
MAIDFINIKIIDRFENDRTMKVEQTQIGAPKLIYNGADDKYAPIMATEFTFNLTVTDKADGKFFHLYTGNEKRYYVLVEDQDENMIFEGYLLPDFYEEPFTNGVIFVNLTATDGIGLLKGHYLPNEYYYKETSVIKLIAECLKKTKLEKTINFAPAIESAATDYRWDEIAVNGKVYLESDEPIRRTGIFFTVEIMPSRKTAYDILELLLKAIGCTLYAQGNQWYIEGINRKHEKVQQNQIFTKDGVYVETINLDKEVKPITFFATPNISIVSPWKMVNVSWDIDEDGDLIKPEDLKGVFVLGEYKASEYWKKNGNINVAAYSKDFARKYQIQSVFGAFDLGTPQAPFHVFIDRSYTEPGNTNPNPPLYGEDETNLPNNFASIAKPKYLKTSDEYLDRSLEFEMVLNGAKVFGTFATIPDGEFSDMFKYDLKIGNQIVLTSKFNNAIAISERLQCDVSDESSSYSADQLAGDYFTLTNKKVVGKVEREEVVMPINGFFNFQLHAPVSEDYTNPLFTGYTIDTLKLKYTEQKTFEDVLERDIDFTTVYDLDIFHGDSIQDLSEKQWRFRRYIPEPETIPGEINVLDSYQTEILSSVAWYFIISYSQAQLIIDNHELLFWALPIPYGNVNIDELESNPTTGASNWQVRWNVSEISPGVWALVILPTPYMLSIGFSLFQSSTPYLQTEGEQPFYGWVTEDNEWRESWKRFGQDEDIRYCVALAKIYHDVQSEAHVKIEGSATDLFFPRDIASFYWIKERDFIFSRVEIDFSRGRTNVLLLEATHEIVDDYVNR